MRPRAPLESAPVTPDAPSVIVTCVHGTWARGTRWPAIDAVVRDALGERGAAASRIAVHYFDWSGRNSVRARTRAAHDLRSQLREQISCYPLARHIVIAHSHGATVVLRAIDDAIPSSPHASCGHSPDIKSALSGIVLLSPPLLDCTLVEEPAVAANKLLLGAAALTPLLIPIVRHIGVALGLSQLAQLATVLALAAWWLTMFRPGAVLRRAEWLAGELSVPRLDVPGLIVRARSDEALLALSGAGAFARIAREAWRTVNRSRSPIRTEEEWLRSARGIGELAGTVFKSLVLVAASWALLSRAHDLAAGRPLLATLLLPVGIVFTTAALAIVGSSVVLLVLLPVFSILLWPFGVFPTCAAALLHVSVTRAPTRAWQVETVGSGFRLVWRHGVYVHPVALEYVREYLRQVVAAPRGANRDAAPLTVDPASIDVDPALI